MAKALLEALNLDVRYGGIAAVKGISFAVEEGEMVCLIGANGAGKTSTLKALVRMIPSRGEIHYGSERIEALPGHELIGKGLALVPEGRGIFARLTVAENLVMGAYHRKDAAGIAADLERIYGLLPRLKERTAQVAGTLSGGEQQMLAIGRCLMGQPELIMFDEPSLGLAPMVVQEVFHIIRLLNQRGITVLLVEQNVAVSLRISAHAYVLENGAVVMSGEGEKLLHDDRVRQAYLGL